tara:strand:+ start:731 stop:961 length:231 start_codon:yes stop_codon:yes gene_type:complete
MVANSLFITVREMGQQLAVSQLGKAVRIWVVEVEAQTVQALTPEVMVEMLVLEEAVLVTIRDLTGIMVGPGVTGQC